MSQMILEITDGSDITLELPQKFDMDLQTGLGPTGPSGKSAYEIAVADGYSGTESEWLESLRGEQGDPGDPGDPGSDGDSAYQIAVADGFVGTEAEWLESLKGEQGDPGDPGADSTVPGPDGPSAYDVAVLNGFEGTESEWIASLKGDQGDPGTPGDPGDPGADGDSAYDVAVANGFVGTEAEWLESLVGEQGDPGDPGADSTVPGPSAYDVAVANGFSGTEGEWLASLVGEQGDPGDPGTDGRGIVSIVRTSGDGSPGTNDTYTITYSDTSTSTYTVHNGSDGTNGSPGSPGDDGRGIVSVTRTDGDGSPGTTDTYTILYSDASTSEFEVYNGADGAGESSATPTVVASAGNAGSTGGSSITLPASGIQDGDLAIFFVGSAYGISSYTNPNVIEFAGLTNLQSNETSVAFANAAIFSRVLSTSDAGTTYSWSMTGNGNWTVHVLIVRGWKYVRASTVWKLGANSSATSWRISPNGIEVRAHPGDLVLTFAYANVASKTLDLVGSNEIVTRSGDTSSSVSGSVEWDTPESHATLYVTTDNATKTGLASGAVAISG